MPAANADDFRRTDFEAHRIEPQITRFHPQHAAVGDFDDVKRGILAIGDIFQ